MLERKEKNERETERANVREREHVFVARTRVGKGMSRVKKRVRLKDDTDKERINCSETRAKIERLVLFMRVAYDFYAEF